MWVAIALTCGLPLNTPGTMNTCRAVMSDLVPTEEICHQLQLDYIERIDKASVENGIDLYVVHLECKNFGKGA